MKKSSVIMPILGAAAMFCAQGAAAAKPEISALTAEYRDGQVFLQWKESALPADARLSVWSSPRPVTASDRGEKVASLLNPRSARDWWLDIDSFIVPRSQKLKSEEIYAGSVASEKDKRGKVKGFVIKAFSKPISPDGGLHVHTPAANQTGKRYFAVTLHSGFNEEILQQISTAAPIEVKEGKATPIFLGRKPIDLQRTKNKPLVIHLHGRGGGSGVDSKGRPVGTYLLFAPKSLAWREGIAFKFSVNIRPDRVEMVLCDRIWIGRKLSRAELSDARDAVPAIATFWFGYNPDIAVSIAGPKYKFDNYTERYMLYLIDWAQKALQTDPNATYLTGGSMGGSGTVQMVTHFPEKFAAGVALVPVYSYSWRRHKGKSNSAFRMQCSTGKFTSSNPALMPDGTDLTVYGDGARNIDRPAIDMPPLFATNGRNDGSIPWENNPPFYKAANRARQAFTVFWNNGNHGMSGDRPKDMKIDFKEIFRLYRLDLSFPAFSNSSDNRNYGKGPYTDGDLVGWINRGMKWSGIVDQPDRYEITLSAGHPDMVYPVTVDVTLRRRQKFLPAAGDKIKVSINGKKSTVKLDKHGLLTLTKVTFNDKKPVKIVLEK